MHIKWHHAESLLILSLHLSTTPTYMEEAGFSKSSMGQKKKGKIGGAACVYRHNVYTLLKTWTRIFHLNYNLKDSNANSTTIQPSNCIMQNLALPS
jgi:hypothetical protein